MEHHRAALRRDSYWPDRGSSGPPGNRFHRWKDTAGGAIASSVAYGSADACPWAVSRRSRWTDSLSRTRRIVVWPDLQLNWTTLLVWGVLRLGRKNRQHERKSNAQNMLTIERTGEMNRNDKAGGKLRCRVIVQFTDNEFSNAKKWKKRTKQKTQSR